MRPRRDLFSLNMPRNDANNGFKIARGDQVLQPRGTRWGRFATTMTPPVLVTPTTGWQRSLKGSYLFEPMQHADRYQHAIGRIEAGGVVIHGPMRSYMLVIGCWDYSIINTAIQESWKLDHLRRNVPCVVRNDAHDPACQFIFRVQELCDNIGSPTADEHGRPPAVKAFSDALLRLQATALKIARTIGRTPNPTDFAGIKGGSNQIIRNYLRAKAPDYDNLQPQDPVFDDIRARWNLIQHSNKNGVLGFVRHVFNHLRVMVGATARNRFEKRVALLGGVGEWQTGLYED